MLRHTTANISKLGLLTKMTSKQKIRGQLQTDKHTAHSPNLLIFANVVCKFGRHSPSYELPIKI